MSQYNSLNYDGFQLDDYFGKGFQLDSQASPFQFNQAGGPNSGITLPENEGFSLGDYTKLGTGIANAYLGYEGLQLGKDQFGFAKGSFNKNLANQAKLINNQMENQERARRGFGGGSTDQADLDAYLAPKKVSGAPV